MSASEQIASLLAKLDKTESVLKRLLQQYDEFVRTDLKALGRKNTTAMVVAEFMVDYYTCLETLFLRISQYFENNLSADRWHADLLEKMMLEIEGVRTAVISETSHSALTELMRFRHFRRYYFELEYDWDKLEYLQAKLTCLRERIPKELDRFRAFLKACA